MAYDVIRKALEAYLAAFPSGLSTAWENKSYIPQANTPWQEAKIAPLPPGNTAVGTEYYQERGMLQIVLHYPQGVGAGAAMARAEALRTYFKRGTSISSVLIPRTPSIGVAISDTEHKEYLVPISIPFTLDVFG